MKIEDIIVRSVLVSNSLIKAPGKQRCKINRDTESIRSGISASRRPCVGKTHMSHTPRHKPDRFVPLPARFAVIKTGPKC